MTRPKEKKLLPGTNHKLFNFALFSAIAALILLGCAPPVAPAASVPTNPPPNVPTFVPPTPPAGTIDLTVFAAASLTDAFNEIGMQFEAAHPGVKVVYNFGGSNTLRAQLEQGARADVFASANATEMENARKAGLVGSEAEIFASNCLVVITPADNPANITTLADLAKPGVKLVFAEENVPVGTYTNQMLEKMSADPEFGTTFGPTVTKNVVSLESSVKAVATKIALGEADAGVVYVSDITPDLAPKVSTIAVPDQFNQIARYPFAPLLDAAQPELARQFVAYVLAKDGGQAILKKWNFIPVASFP